MAKKILYIDRSAFIDWYFDEDTLKDFTNRHGLLSSLMIDGTFTITADELLADVGYLPSDLAFCGQTPIVDENDEIVMDVYDEIKFMQTQPA